MSKTRKRGAEDGPSTVAPKGKKRKGNMDKDESYDTELGINTTFARMDNQLLADHLLQKLTRFGSDLSPVEVSDLTISGEL
jgi:protein CMS1